MASRVADAIGRKRTMVAIAAGYVVFAALSGAANGLVFLDVARFFLGVTIGLSVVVAPVFIAESSPPRIRGGLIVSYQVATVAGIMSSYLVGVIGGVWTFTMFLVLAALSFGYVWWLAPETKGRPLESVRDYWENGGRWPAETAPSPAVGRDRADSPRHAA